MKIILDVGCWMLDLMTNDKRMILVKGIRLKPYGFGTKKGSRFKVKGIKRVTMAIEGTGWWW